MARIYELGCLRGCFARLQPKRVDPTEELQIGLEMMDVQERRTQREIDSLTEAAQALARSNRRAEAKQKLRQRAAAKSRLTHLHGMQDNMRSMLEFAKGNEVFRYGIKAMHNMTREFSGSSVNFQGMYRDLESAQDSFTELMDNQDDINSLLQNGLMNRGAADDDDLELELNELLRGPSEDALPLSSPAAASAASAASAESPAMLEQLLPPPPTSISIEDLRARVRTPPVAVPA